MRHVGLSILLAVSVAGCASGKASGDDGNCNAGEILSGGACVALCSDDSSCSGQRYCNDGMCVEGVRPEIAAHSPEADATDVAADASVVLSFSVAMDPASSSAAFSLIGPQGAVAGDLVWSGTNVVLTFTPATPLKPGSSYRVQVTESALSAAGVPFGAIFSFSFEVYLPAVAVVGMTPVPGSVDVGVVPNISVTFSVPMDLVSMTQTFHLLASGVTEVGGNISLDTAGMLLTFTPGGNLVFNTTYQARIDAGAESVAGATLAAPWERSFTTTATPDLSLPAVATDAISVIVAGPQLDGLSSFTFTGTASDADTPIEQVQVQIVTAGSPLGTDWVAATVTPSGNSATWSYRWFPKMVTPLPNGTYTLHARAYDKGGNPKLAAPMSFEADLVPPPTPTFTSQPPSQWKFAQLTVSVAGEVNSTVQVLIDNVAIAGSPFALGGAGVAAINLTLPAAVGAHPMAIFGVDENGNRNETPLTKVIERIAYTCLTSSNGFPTPGATIATAASFADPTGLVTITYEIGGGFGENAMIDPGNPTSVYGSSTQMDFAATWLFRFAASLLPTCATVESAVLSFTKYSYTGSSSQAEARPLLKDWTETQVTWNKATSVVAWQTPGAQGSADRGALLGSVTSAGSGTSSTTLNVTIPAQGWAVTPTTNFGIVLVSTDYSWGLYTNDSTTASYRPRLVLQLREPQ